MSAGVLSGIVTAVLLVLFVLGWIRLYAADRRAELESAARLALEPEDASFPAAATRESQA